MAKPTYRSFVVERHVGAERTVVWAQLVDLLDGGLIHGAGLGAERVLSFEPPWRRVGRFELAPLGLVDHTLALRDDGDQTHIVWAYVAEWPFVDPDDAVAAGADTVLARLQAAVTNWADALTSRTSRSAGAS